MNSSELRIMALTALQKNPDTEPENPKWDSLDKLEIITAVHDSFGDQVADVADLDNFSDLESLYQILNKHGLVS